MAKNKGEIEEMRLKLALAHLRDSNYDYSMPYIGKIISVGLESEYKTTPFDNLGEIKNLTSNEVEKYSAEIGALKAPSKSKSDVLINGIGISLKCSAASPSAIVNHTHRKGFEFVCSNIGSSISVLDLMVDRYWELRSTGKIKEDTHVVDPLFPFNDKNYFIPIVKYFLFKGTGSSISTHPASYVLDFPDTTNPQTWKILSQEEIVDKLWNNLVFSIRSKAMPKNYDPENSLFKSISRWSKFWQEKYRGTLHIRVKK